MTDRRRQEDELRALVRRVVPGARIYFPRRRAYRWGLSWNGRHLRPTGLTLESQLHEIAHLLLASPERRRMPEFGLGPDPYRRNDVPCVIPREDADLEETHTCWLQLLLAHLLGLDEVAVQVEFQLAPLTRRMVTTLERSHPDALPPRWWQRARTLMATLDAG